MKTLHERVTRAITKSGHTASSAAKKLDVSPEAVLQWMSGATKNIRPTNLFALSDITGFSARWIATGEGHEIDVYKTEPILHVMEVMEHLTPADQYRLSRMADAFVDQASNDHDQPPSHTRKFHLDR